MISIIGKRAAFSALSVVSRNAPPRHIAASAFTSFAAASGATALRSSSSEGIGAPTG